MPQTFLALSGMVTVVTSVQSSSGMVRRQSALCDGTSISLHWCCNAFTSVMFLDDNFAGIFCRLAPIPRLCEQCK